MLEKEFELDIVRGLVKEVKEICETVEIEDVTQIMSDQGSSRKELRDGVRL